ncbi:hypothetical protein BU16DRAFT_555676 [Lophium mytilinum]|uniref:Uncharacterized protein n=1 Tax=Lophium mytilinum TaxID=390894 RepID=A0A6A6RCK2_9PEZI|nr:hypothetical protein BU16DRAFT_555676 [Lophium mytilinum]
MVGTVVDDQNEIGTAVGIAGLIRSAVSAVASKIYAVVLKNRLEMTIPAIVLLAMEKADFQRHKCRVSYTIEVAGIAAYKLAINQEYHTVMLVTIAFSGLGTLFSFWASNVDELMTTRVSLTRHKRRDEEVLEA